MFKNRWWFNLLWIDNWRNCKIKNRLPAIINGHRDKGCKRTLLKVNIITRIDIIQYNKIKIRRKKFT